MKGGKVLEVVVSLALPAAAIVIAALAQLVLTAIWPGIRAIRSSIVSIDSYFVLILAVGLCFVAARWIRRKICTRFGATCALVAPSLWLAIFAKGTLFLGHGPIAWSRPITIFAIVTAVAPLISVGLGLALPRFGADRVPWTA